MELNINPKLRPSFLPVKNFIKTIYHDHVWLKNIKQNFSRLDPKQAKQYISFLKSCQKNFELNSKNLNEDTIEAINNFNLNGYTTLWSQNLSNHAQSLMKKIKDIEKHSAHLWSLATTTQYDGLKEIDNQPPSGYMLYNKPKIYETFSEIEEIFKESLGPLFEGIYKSYYKIYYGIISKAIHSPFPGGSQLWHNDGGPGTCINLMFYLSDTSPEHGAMEVVPWDISLKIFEKEQAFIRSVTKRFDQNKNGTLTKNYLRAHLAEFYKTELETRFPTAIQQPHGKAGLAVAFRNNTLHKGGYPMPGYQRYALIFHIYPSSYKTPFEQYRQSGVDKRASYPINPAENF